MGSNDIFAPRRCSPSPTLTFVHLPVREVIYLHLVRLGLLIVVRVDLNMPLRLLRLDAWVVICLASPPLFYVLHLVLAPRVIPVQASAAPLVARGVVAVAVAVAVVPVLLAVRRCASPVLLPFRVVATFLRILLLLGGANIRLEVAVDVGCTVGGKGRGEFRGTGVVGGDVT